MEIVVPRDEHCYRAPSREWSAASPRPRNERDSSALTLRRIWIPKVRSRVLQLAVKQVTA